jgi:hypothetical protein
MTEFYRESWKTFSDEAIENTKKIQEINDRVRRAEATALVLIAGDMSQEDSSIHVAAMKVVSEFDAFNEENDPHGEHDHGSFDLNGEKCMWKIDYCDLELRFGSEKPWDETVTKRVLTIFYARDY